MSASKGLNKHSSGKPMENQENSQIQHIQLDQFLKLKNFVGSGGEAKHLIQSGKVLVNGQPETRRGRKLRAGDLVSIGSKEIKVDLP